MNPEIAQWLEHLPASITLFILFIGLSVYGLVKNHRLVSDLMLDPYAIARGRKLYTIISSGFIHADFQHLLFNGLTYFFFAFPLEATIGTTNFLIIFFVSLILSDVQTLIQNRNDVNYRALGASGAISGVLFSFILFYPNNQISLLLFPIGIPAYLFAILYVAYCVWADRKQYDNVNHNAHLWGAVSGFGLTALIFPDYFNEFILNFQVW